MAALKTMELGRIPVGREADCVNVLGINVAFRPGADMARAREAAQIVEQQYAALKSSGVQGKDIMLTFLALSLADELLQMRTRQESLKRRLESLLEKIETSL